MIRPFFNFALFFSLSVFSLPIYAQQSEKIPRIGFLAITSRADTAPRVAAFRQALRDLRYVEGKTIAIDDRYAEGKLDRLRTMAAELVQRKVAVIVTSGPLGTRTAKEATATIPIVMAF
jgi:putative ABC transport system substrate-binding protein